MSCKQLENVIAKYPHINKIHTILKSHIIPQLSSLALHPFIVPLPLSDSKNYWQDYAATYIKEFYNFEILDASYIYFTYYLDNSGKQINISRPININYSPMNKEIKSQVIDIFEKYLPSVYQWSGSNNQSMKLFLDNYNAPQRKIKKSKLKDQDTYPLLYITFDTKINLFNDNNMREMLIKYFMKYYKKYQATWECGENDFIVSLYSFDNDNKVIEEIKKYLKTSKIVKRYSIVYIENDDNNNLIEKEL